MADASVSVGIVEKSKLFVQEAIGELKKVTWPDQAQLKSATGVVLLFVAGISVVIFLMDLAVRSLVDAILAIFGA